MPDVVTGEEGPALAERLWKELEAELSFVDFSKTLTA